MNFLKKTYNIIKNLIFVFTEKTKKSINKIINNNFVENPEPPKLLYDSKINRLEIIYYFFNGYPLQHASADIII